MLVSHTDKTALSLGKMRFVFNAVVTWALSIELMFYDNMLRFIFTTKCYISICLLYCNWMCCIIKIFYRRTLYIILMESMIINIKKAYFPSSSNFQLDKYFLWSLFHPYLKGRVWSLHSWYRTLWFSWGYTPVGAYMILLRLIHDHPDLYDSEIDV